MKLPTDPRKLIGAGIALGVAGTLALIVARLEHASAWTYLLAFAPAFVGGQLVAMARRVSRPRTAYLELDLPLAEANAAAVRAARKAVRVEEVVDRSPERVHVKFVLKTARHVLELRLSELTAESTLVSIGAKQPRARQLDEEVQRAIDATADVLRVEHGAR